MKTALFFLLLLMAAVSAMDVKGVINLDSVTFSKLVGTDQFHVLVKFDKQYPYGDKEDQFKEFAKRIGELTTASDVLIASVGVQEYGDKLNEDLRDRFGVKNEDFPVFKLFKKGSVSPISYTGEITADSLVRFLKNELKIYIGLPGCLEEYDQLAKGFLSASAAEQKTRLGQAESALSKLTKEADQESAKFYVAMMKKVGEKGKDAVSGEKTRLEKLVTSKITDEKKKQMRLKLNILPSFSE